MTIKELDDLNNSIKSNLLLIKKEIDNNYLITNDNYYPGWTASTGAIQNVLGLRAVQLKSGQGTEVISYHSKSFKVGLGITIGGIAILLVAIFII